MKKILFLLFVASPLLFSQCDDNNDGFSLDDQWISLATVTRPAEAPNSAFFLTLDNGEILWAGAPIGFTQIPYPTGQRLLTNFTYLGAAPATAPYNYNVLVNGVRVILTKNVTPITTAAQADSVGNSPFVAIEDMEIGSDFLNVDFRMLVNNQRHLLSLVLNKQSGAAPFLVGDTVNVSLRQNAFGDTGGFIARDLVCFNLTQLRQYAQTGTSQIYVKVTVPLTNGKTYTFKELYNWGVPSKTKSNIKTGGDLFLTKSEYIK